MTLIPDLERQLTDAAASRSGNRRRVARLAAAGGAAVALMAALFALTLGQPGDSSDRGGDEQRTGGPLGLELPAGHKPELRDLIAAFRREQTPRDDNGFTRGDLDEIPDRQPGEDPTKSRRVDLPSGPVYLWPMTDGVCSSFGGCIGLDTLIDVGGVAVGTSYNAALDGRPEKREINGVVVDGIEEVRLIRPGADEIVVPVKENVFRLDATRTKPLPAGSQLQWRDASGRLHTFEHQLFPGVQFGR